MTRKTAQREAAKLGHKLTNFEAQRSRTGSIIYYLARCENCGAPCFAEDAAGETTLGNPALQGSCPGRLWF